MTDLSITDGEPLTYDLINAIITKVNNIDNLLKTRLGIDSFQKIKVVGSPGPGIDLSESRGILIACGYKNITLDTKTTYNDVLSYAAANFSRTPHVVATIADIRGSGEPATVAAPYATVSLGIATTQSVPCRVDLIKPAGRNTIIKVNYIAIGAVG